ncbi:MAG: ABC transporter ATP-binding protein [Victivallales bacterium]|nr:ABC transporter ATP-binding protein [Victivallales bacterium]MCF7889147.1 ABC transporter ATP-binding protein [Victivallales bacterium]
MIDIDIKIRLKKEMMHYCFSTSTDRSVVFGPSGSGKTTLLKAIAGFYKPLEGRITVNNKFFFDKKLGINIPIYKRKLGYLPQQYTLFPNMNIKDNILYGVNKKKYGKTLEKLNFITERLQIKHKLQSAPHLLSEGQQKRAALARIFMMNPNILLLDEPFTALDEPIRECLRGFVIELSQELKIPVLFVSHSIEDSFSLGKEIIVINNGKVVEYGNLNKVYNIPKYTETAGLLDFKNIFLIETFNEKKITLSNLKQNDRLVMNHNRKFEERCTHLSIRPEKVHILNKENNNGENIFSGIIDAVHPRGSYFKVNIRIGSFLLISYVDEKQVNRYSLYADKKVSVKVNSGDLVFCREI